VLVRLSIEERKAKMSTQPMTSEKQTFALAVHFRIAGSISTPAIFIGKMVRNQPENWPESQQKSQQILQNSRMFANVS